MSNDQCCDSFGGAFFPGMKKISFHIGIEKGVCLYFELLIDSALQTRTAPPPCFPSLLSGRKRQTTGNRQSCGLDKPNVSLGAAHPVPRYSILQASIPSSVLGLLVFEWDAGSLLSFMGAFKALLNCFTEIYQVMSSLCCINKKGDRTSYPTLIIDDQEPDKLSLI